MIMMITVHVKPGARENKLEWLDKETVKISVTAAPIKGKANKAVLKILATELDIAQTRLEIIRGKTARIKQIVVGE